MLCIHDDLCVHAKNDEKHDRNLLNLMWVASKKSMVLKSSRRCYSWMLYPSYLTHLKAEIPLDLQVEHIVLSHFGLAQIGLVNINCSVLSTGYQLILNGWPKWIHQVPHITQYFWGNWDELSIEDYLHDKGDWVCIPPELYSKTLADLYSSHQGTEKM